MTVQYLRYFIEIYRTGSVYQAAKNLFVTPQGISRGLKQLEKSIHLPLFIHKQNKLTPTDFGNAFYSRAVIAYKSLEDLEVFASNYLLSGENSIRIGLMGYSRTSYMILSLIENFQKENPEVLINTTFYEQSQHNLLTMKILNGELDVGWCYHTKIDPAFAYSTVKNAPLKCLISSDNPLSQKDILNWSDLEDEPFIFSGKNDLLPMLIRKHCLQCGFKPYDKFFSTDSSFVSQLVARNHGVAFLYEDQINRNRHFYKNAAIKSVHPELLVQLSFILNKEKENAPLIKRLLAYLTPGLKQLESNPD